MIAGDVAPPRALIQGAPLVYHDIAAMRVDAHERYGWCSHIVTGWCRNVAVYVRQLAKRRRPHHTFFRVEIDKFKCKLLVDFDRDEITIWRQAWRDAPVITETYNMTALHIAEAARNVFNTTTPPRAAFKVVVSGNGYYAKVRMIAAYPDPGFPTLKRLAEAARLESLPGSKRLQPFTDISTTPRNRQSRR